MLISLVRRTIPGIFCLNCSSAALGNSFPHVFPFSWSTWRFMGQTGPRGTSRVPLQSQRDERGRDGVRGWGWHCWHRGVTQGHPGHLLSPPDAPVPTPVTNGRPSSLEKDLDLFASVASGSDSRKVSWECWCLEKAGWVVEPQDNFGMGGV